MAALSGLTVTCGYSGGDGFDTSKQPILSNIQWSEEPASNTATTNVAPTAPDNNTVRPVFRLYATANSWVSVGPSPNPAASPRCFVPATTIYDIYAKPGDKLKWIADA